MRFPVCLRLFNPFLADVLILYPLKTPGVFKGYKMGTLARNDLKRNVSVWSSKTVRLGKPVPNHIILIFIYREVYHFVELSEGYFDI